jgi:MFS family permease
MSMTFESGFMSYLMADLNLDNTKIGMIFSVRALMEIPFLFFIAKLRRRIKLPYLIMSAAVFMGLECLTFSFLVTNFTQMLIFASLYGFGGGLWIGTGSNYIYELAPVHLRATAHGLFISVSQVSGILGSLVGGVLFDSIGGRAFYCVVACLFAFSVLVFACSLLIKKKPAVTSNP